MVYDMYRMIPAVFDIAVVFADIAVVVLVAGGRFSVVMVVGLKVDTRAFISSTWVKIATQLILCHYF